MRVLFVSNGHGEMAIAARIAAELRRERSVQTDHFSLVGTAANDTAFPPVGPQRAMPSGGLVAMGNVRAFLSDLRAGFLGLWFAQRRFLREGGAAYACVVAVGDAYCLFVALASRRPVVFAGTAKSVYVAPYGPSERATLRRASSVFVRDRATAAFLQTHGVAAEAPGNVIADLAQSDERFDWAAQRRIAVLPGSRQSAYAAAARIGSVLGRLDLPDVEVAVSIAPGIDRVRILQYLAVPARAWDGPIGALFSGATLAFGQAGTANEAAAARGLPVVALADRDGRGDDWYRMRQRRLLDGALAVLPADAQSAADALRALMLDEQRLAAMAAVGRERMGAPGGAAAIAERVAAIASGRQAR